jgi:hypothetical protein
MGTGPHKSVNNLKWYITFIMTDGVICLMTFIQDTILVFKTREQYIFK